MEKTNATNESSDIAANGKVTFFYVDPDNAPAQRFGTYNVTFTFTRDGITAERTVPVVVYWDQTQVKNTMTKEILDKVTLEGIATVEGAEQQPCLLYTSDVYKIQQLRHFLVVHFDLTEIHTFSNSFAMIRSFKTFPEGKLSSPIS